PDRPRRPLRHQPRGVGPPELDRPRDRAGPGGPRRLRQLVRRPPDARPVLAPRRGRGLLPFGEGGGTDLGGVPGRAAGVRPVSQAPVRPLEPDRLPLVCQRLQPGPLRQLARTDGDDGRPAGRPPADKAGPALPRLREVYIGDARPQRMTHPDTGYTLRPKAPGGPELDEARDPREALFAWMVRPDNPYFARSFVNRVWAHYFGV